MSTRHVALCERETCGMCKGTGRAAQDAECVCVRCIGTGYVWTPIPLPVPKWEQKQAEQCSDTERTG